MSKRPLDLSLLPENNTLLWCRQACARLLQPVVRLALRFGLKHADLDQILREELIQEAERHAPRKGSGKPNISQIAAITGLQRRDITERLEPESSIEITDRSWSSQVFTAWLHQVNVNPVLRTLPISPPEDSPEATSFSSLAREITKGNVHHRTLLNELRRLDLVDEGETTVSLKENSFIPREDQKLMFSFAGDNGRDHLHAVIANLEGHKPPFLEQAVFSEGIRLEDCLTTQALARAQWQLLHQVLISHLTEAESGKESLPKEAAHRVRVGMYVYYEAQSDA